MLELPTSPSDVVEETELCDSFGSHSTEGQRGTAMAVIVIEQPSLLHSFISRNRAGNLPMPARFLKCSYGASMDRRGTCPEATFDIERRLHRQTSRQFFRSTETVSA